MNYRCRNGEIDIIAKDGEYLVFCEVKYRRDLKYGEGLEAVDLKKQRKISMCALYYITEKGMDRMPVRFDVVSILGDGKVKVVKDAFDFCG